MQGANATISSERILTVSGKDSYASGPLSSVSAYIEPAEKEPSEFINGESAFYVFMCVVDGSVDVKISDRITDDLGNIYTVKGVQFFRGGDVPSHTEIILIKKRDDYI